jgi:hypothetical protein
MTIRLRQEHVDAFAAQRRARFIADRTATLGEIWPRHLEFGGPERLRRMIAGGVATAERYGLHTERQLARYLNVMMALGYLFDRQPWAQAILTHPTHPPDVKIELLCMGTNVLLS